MTLPLQLQSADALMAVPPAGNHRPECPGGLEKLFFTAQQRRDACYP